MVQVPGGRFEALAHPVRMRIVRLLRAQRTASVREMAAAAGVHPNTARAHVSALEDAAIIVREPQPARGRGRPALRFRLLDDSPPPAADLHGLAQLLAAALGPPRGGALSRLRGLGRRWARRERVEADSDIGRRLAEILGRLGFHARLEDGSVELSGCPCPLVAPEHPETVCALVHGTADGILAPHGLRVGTARHDPARRRCELTLGS